MAEQSGVLAGTTTQVVPLPAETGEPLPLPPDADPVPMALTDAVVPDPDPEPDPEPEDEHTVPPTVPELAQEHTEFAAESTRAISEAAHEVATH